MYYHGEGVQARDGAAAARYYRRAAELGAASAMNSLGLLYLEVRRVRRQCGAGGSGRQPCSESQTEPLLGLFLGATS